MGNLIRGVRFFYLLWGGMLVGTLTINNRIRLPDPVWHWPWLAQLFYTVWGRGLLLGIAAAMSLAAAYIVSSAQERDPHEFVPEESRRARAVPVYAVLRSLGRDGLRAMVERHCSHARRMAERLGADPAVRILNEVVLNQVLVRFEDPHRDADALTREVIAGVQQEGTCWLGGTVWHGMAAMRISISNWSTTEQDIDRSADAILAVLRARR